MQLTSVTVALEHPVPDPRQPRGEGSRDVWLFVFNTLLVVECLEMAKTSPALNWVSHCARNQET